MTRGEKDAFPVVELFLSGNGPEDVLPHAMIGALERPDGRAVIGVPEWHCGDG